MKAGLVRVELPPPIMLRLLICNQSAIPDNGYVDVKGPRLGNLSLTCVFTSGAAGNRTPCRNRADVMKERGLRASCPSRARMLGVFTLFHDEGGPL